MSTLAVADIKRSLLKKGFSEERNTKHTYYFYYYKGKKTSIRTFVSFGEDSIREPLIHRMSKEVNLDKEKFMRLIQCTLSGPDYLKIQLSKGKIE